MGALCTLSRWVQEPWEQRGLTRRLARAPCALRPTRPTLITALRDACAQHSFDLLNGTAGLNVYATRLRSRFGRQLVLLLLCSF